MWNQDGFFGNKRKNYLLQRSHCAVVCNQNTCKELMCLYGGMAISIQLNIPTDFNLLEGSVQWSLLDFGFSSLSQSSCQPRGLTWRAYLMRCWVFWVTFDLVSCWRLWFLLWETEHPQQPLRESSFFSLQWKLILMLTVALCTLCWDIFHLPAFWLELPCLKHPCGVGGGQG